MDLSFFIFSFDDRQNKVTKSNEINRISCLSDARIDERSDNWLRARLGSTLPFRSFRHDFMNCIRITTSREHKSNDGKGERPYESFFKR